MYKRQELTSDYHFILNPDIQLTADTLSDLADWMAAHPDAVMARPGLRFPDGRSQSLPLRRCALRPMVYRQLPFLKFWEKYNLSLIHIFLNATLVNEDDAVGDFAGKAHLMGDHQHGDAGMGQLFHQLKHFTDHLGVEGAGRPVSYTHLRRC